MHLSSSATNICLAIEAELLDLSRQFADGLRAADEHGAGIIEWPMLSSLMPSSRASGMTLRWVWPWPALRSSRVGRAIAAGRADLEEGAVLGRLLLDGRRELGERRDCGLADRPEHRDVLTSVGEESPQPLRHRDHPLGLNLSVRANAAANSPG